MSLPLLLMVAVVAFDTQVFNEIVIPLMGLDQTSVVGITTPSDSDNYVSKLITLRTASGAPVFTGGPRAPRPPPQPSGPHVMQTSSYGTLLLAAQTRDRRQGR